MTPPDAHTGDSPLDLLANQPVVLLATDTPFWREANGTNARVAALYKWLRAEEFRVPVYLLMKPEGSDWRTLDALYPDLEMYFAPDKSGRVPRWARRQADGTYTEQGYESSSVSKSRRALQSVLPEASLTKLAKLKSRVLPAKKQIATNDDESTLADFRNEAALAHFAAKCDQLKPRAVIAQYVRLAWLGEALTDRANTRFILDTIDVMHQRAEAFHAHGERHWLTITREEEAAALSVCDALLAIQEREAATLREMLPDARVLVATHPAPIYPHKRKPKKLVTLVYVGANSPPNAQALAAFLKETWPRLRDQFGDRVTLRVAGSVIAAFEDDGPEGVVWMGHVDDLAVFYSGADIAINPVTFGGGLKIKCVEALCHGLPLVTTPVGAEGLENGANEAFIVADEVNEFHEALAALIEDNGTRRDLGEKALAFARKHFSPEAAFGELGAYLRDRAY